LLFNIILNNFYEKDIVALIIYSVGLSSAPQAGNYATRLNIEKRAQFNKSYATLNKPTMFGMWPIQYQKFQKAFSICTKPFL